MHRLARDVPAYVYRSVCRLPTSAYVLASVFVPTSIYIPTSASLRSFKVCLPTILPTLYPFISLPRPSFSRLHDSKKKLTKTYTTKLFQFQAERSSLNIFVHLWSLSVEMQFYLLVPFIFFGLQHYKKETCKLMTVSIISIFGFVGFALVNSAFAFNFMFLRLWQFSAGFIALFWTKSFPSQVAKISEKSENSDVSENKFQKFCSVSKEDSVMLALTVISLCALPTKIDVLISRPMVTAATAFIIAVESKDNQVIFNKRVCLQNKRVCLQKMSSKFEIFKNSKKLKLKCTS